MLKKFNSIALAMVFCASIALAQVTTGTISGVVRDATGAVVPGASVVVRNVETGVSRTVSTDAQGQYRAPNISLGRYEVQASLTGFQTAVRSGISLSVGQEAAVNFTLEVGQVTERVEVTGEAPLVETTRSDVGGVIEENQVTDLPLNGRSFLQLAQLQTGMVAARNASNLSFGGQQTVLATSGSQAGSSSFLLDGSDISDYMFAQTPGGASGLAVGLEMIREFRVLTNSFSAEYGRSSGGVLSVVTKSGTNQLEGTVFWFHRNDNLDARNFFDGAKSPEFRRNQFGGTLGGPIVRDKTFFLGSYEGLREGLGQTALAIVPSLRAREGFLPRSGGGEDNVGVAPAVRPFLNLYPLPTGQTFPNGTAEARSLGTQPTNEDFFSGRIDHVLSEKDTLFGRYTFRDGTTIVPFGSTPVPGFGAVGDQRHQYMTAEETHVFSPTVLNSFRASYNRSRKDNPTDPPAPETCASLLPACSGQGPVRPGSGVDPLGNRASRPSFSTVNLFQVHDSVYVTRGSHSLKFGTEITRFQGHFDYHFNLNGTYGFRNLSDFLRGAPNTFEGVLPGADLIRGWRWTYLGFYVQDEWRMFPNFTLNLGLRYEPQTNPKEVNGKLANLLDPLNDSKMTVVDSLFSDNPGRKLFQPRVGFAWDPFRNGKLALRGGFGVFFDKVHSNTFNGQNTNVPFATTVLINDPLFPKALRPGETFTPTSISVSTITPDRNFSYPYSMQWNFSIQQEIVPSTVVSATYAGSRGVHI
ncbi:MAG: TonB-dependent receptor, partial [Acidobacteria bacterium]|nr:TonB-dependent receptor [Acidobacteriota bacterium]